MMVKRIAGVMMLGLSLSVGPLATSAWAATIPTHSHLSVTAARPGVRLVSSGKGQVPSQSSEARRVTISTGEGSGKGFCARYNGHTLGASFDNVYTCGPSTGTGDDFDTIGFQCVELSERFLWVVYGDIIPDVMSGKDLVDDGHAALGLPVGLSESGSGSLPAIGDVLSMWGGPKAQSYGHTAVVTSVDVDTAGDGTVGIMEENGASDGWDQLTVTNWRLTYGDPSWDGGVFYYNHVKWLELQPSPPTVADSAIQFTVQGLGAGSVASAVNGTNTVVGYVNHTMLSGGAWHQPFVVNGTTWSYPKTPSPALNLVGINDHGAIAAWAPQTDAAPAGYAMHSPTKPKWDVLPLPSGRVNTDQTTSIDSFGDITGWLSMGHSTASTSGAVWVRSGATYQLRQLAPNVLFHDPVVWQADHYGDAVGSETTGGTKTFAVLWAPWGKAYRLPGVSTITFDSVARAMTAQTSDGIRTLTIVGSSTDNNGNDQAVEWSVSVGADSVAVGQPIELAQGSSILGPSAATGINSSGWVIGSLDDTTEGHQVFVYRADFGMLDLATLLPPSSPWILETVAGVNNAGTIVGQAFNSAVDQPGTTRGVILTPHAVTTAPPTSK
jgi:hypothetical protein